MSGSTIANYHEMQALAGGQPVVTSYTYNGDQLATAAASDEQVAWNYAYDLEGRLAEVTPSGGSLAGAQRYSYSAAGYLVQTESHDGTAYQPQAEMAYNGLGQRQSMTAHVGGLSLATTYVLDTEQNAAPLMATANGQTTYYLYGLEPVAERAASWSYYLRDGLGSVRRLADSTGEIVLERSYTPWGDVLTQSGTLTPAHGYLGGWVDAVTGLIYEAVLFTAGNGQYYDPATGRFLTRDAQPGQFNPYLPNRGDPTGLLIGPLALVALARRRKGGKVNLFLVALVVLLVGGMTVTACTPPIDGEPPKTITPPPHEGTGTPTPTSTSTSTPTQTQSPTTTPTPTATCTQALTLTSTPASTSVIFFGGSNGQSLADLGLDPNLQTPVWVQGVTQVVQYTGPSKAKQANDVNIDTYKNDDLIIIGYSAGADTALMFADKYLRENSGTGQITDIALLGPTLAGKMTDGRDLAVEWMGLLDQLLKGTKEVEGTDVYFLDDRACGGHEGMTYQVPSSATGTFHFEYRTIWADCDLDAKEKDRTGQEHWDGGLSGQLGIGTNNSQTFRDDVFAWFAEH